MSHLQDLLDKEARLSNKGEANGTERQQILTAIRLMRDENFRPPCFGEDDCSTSVLMRCPWRFDCGEST